jgi:protein required for attachment to host cells
MSTTWILIADGGRARLFEQERGARTFKPVAERDFVGARAQSREIASDRPGRTFDSSGRGQPGDVGSHGRHAMEPGTDPQRYAEYEFARELRDHLQKAANEHRFDRLVLVAAPKILGDLRSLLPKPVQDTIVAEVNKDLTRTPTAELGAHLDHHLAK